MRKAYRLGCADALFRYRQIGNSVSLYTMRCRIRHFHNYFLRGKIAAGAFHWNIRIFRNTLPSCNFSACRRKNRRSQQAVFSLRDCVQCSMKLNFFAAMPYFSRHTALSSKCRFKSALVETTASGREWPNRGCRLGYRREYFIADQSDAHLAHLGDCFRTRSS